MTSLLSTLGRSTRVDILWTMKVRTQEYPIHLTFGNVCSYSVKVKGVPKATGDVGILPHCRIKDSSIVRRAWMFADETISANTVSKHGGLFMHEEVLFALMRPAGLAYITTCPLSFNTVGEEETSRSFLLCCTPRFIIFPMPLIMRSAHHS